MCEWDLLSENFERDISRVASMPCSSTRATDVPLEVARHLRKAKSEVTRRPELAELRRHTMKMEAAPVLEPMPASAATTQVSASSQDSSTSDWDLLTDSFSRGEVSRTPSENSFSVASSLPKSQSAKDRSKVLRRAKFSSDPATSKGRVAEVRFGSEPKQFTEGTKCTEGATLEDFYDISWLCGRGKNSIVRHAEHKLTGKCVVVRSSWKIQMDKGEWDKLVNGVEIHKELEHPRIVRVEDVYRSPRKVSTVLEYLGGGDLKQELDKRGRFSEEEASYIIRQLLDALDYLHSQGIVHTDIKLQNIMLKTADELDVKLTDFDFATKLSDSGEMSPECGTSVDAPEIFHGEYSDKVDIFSVGIVAHELLTGDLVCRSKLQGYGCLSEKLREYSPGAHDFVKALLHPDPAIRPPAAKALQHPWL